MSRFSSLKKQFTKRKNAGNEYEGSLLLKSTSNLLWDNLDMITVGNYIENYLNNLIYMVKNIKKQFNFLEDKESNDIN